MVPDAELFIYRLRDAFLASTPLTLLSLNRQ